MADFAVVGIVGEILRELLRTNLSETFNGDFDSTGSPNAVTLQSPKVLEEDVNLNRVSLFLYQIIENAYLKNQPMERTNGGQLRYPPLSLNLYYLLTPYAGEISGIKGWDLHTILGRAMQVFYDNALMEGPALFDVLKGAQREEYAENIEQIKVILNPVSLDDLTKIWNSLDTPMRLSVCYEVRVIMIESERKKGFQRITEKDSHYYQIT